MNAVTKHIEHEPMLPATVVTPMSMLDRALAGGATMEVIEKLMALQERWEANAARKAFDAAIADAKSEIPVILKNKTVDFTSLKGRTTYQYEDLAEIAKTVDPIISKYGLSYRFRSMIENGAIKVICMLSHRDGHCEENSVVGPRDESGNKNAHQAIASGITYLQRITLKLALGLAASTDDDGARSQVKVNETPPESIMDDQVAEIERMLVAKNANREAFLKHFKIEDLSQMYVSEYVQAIAMLAKMAVRT